MLLFFFVFLGLAGRLLFPSPPFPPRVPPFRPAVVLVAWFLPQEPPPPPGVSEEMAAASAVAPEDRLAIDNIP